MENVNFEEWLLKYYQHTIQPLRYILKEIEPYRDHLPNTHNFIIWLLDSENGLYSGLLSLIDDGFADEASDTKFIITEINGKIKNYSNFEKEVILNIVVTYFGVGMHQSKGFYKAIFEELIIYFRSLLERLKSLNNDFPFKVLNKHFDLYNDNGEKLPAKEWTIINKNQSKPKPQPASTIILPPIQEITPKQQQDTQKITPIKLELNQTQIVYLFYQLAENGYINKDENPNLWSLISKYFVDKNNKPLNNIRQTKYNLENTKKGKPQKSETIDKIINFLNEFKEID